MRPQPEVEQANILDNDAAQYEAMPPFPVEHGPEEQLLEEPNPGPSELRASPQRVELPPQPEGRSPQPLVEPLLRPQPTPCLNKNSLITPH